MFHKVIEVPFLPSFINLKKILYTTNSVILCYKNALIFIKGKKMTFSDILTFEITDILEHLEHNGFAAFLVGGCVRDAILKRECHDIDIATNASTYEMLEIFKEYETMTCGIGFGTVNVRGKSGNIFDITSFRQEGEYLDGRHPSYITFSGDIHTDLARRDFTVNSMAVNMHHELVDDFGGLNDCTIKQIKCVRNPKLRFSEDYLRILRALRFSAVLDFSVETQTAEAIRELSLLTENIPAERAFDELKKLFSTPYNLRLSKLLNDFPEVFNVFFPDSDLQKSAIRLETLHDEKNFILKMAMILSQTDSAKFYFLNHENFFSKSDEKLFHSLLYIDSQKLQNRNDAVKQISLLGKENLEKIRTLKKSSPTELKFINEIQNDIDSGTFPFGINELAIKGTDLISAGLHGKAIGQTLDLLLNLVQNKKLSNEKEALLEWVKENT